MSIEFTDLLLKVLLVAISNTVRVHICSSIGHAEVNQLLDLILNRYFLCIAILVVVNRPNDWHLRLKYSILKLVVVALRLFNFKITALIFTLTVIIALRSFVV